METSSLKRHLAAVLYADVAGYSRLTGEDEEGTHRRLGAGLDTLTAAVERHGGRVVHFAGDAVLAEFASAVQALACAGEAQAALLAANRDRPREQRLEFRVGLNLGDVIDDRASTSRRASRLSPIRVASASPSRCATRSATSCRTATSSSASAG